MNTLSIDFAFEGFRIIRHKPWLILLWGSVLLVGTVAAWACALPLAWPTIKPFVNGAAFPTEPMALVSLFSSLILPLIVLGVIALIARVIVQCAIYRLVLDSPQRGFGYMRLGGDEVRMFFFAILMGFLMGLVSFASSLLGHMVGGVLNIANHQGGAGDFIAFIIQYTIYYYVLTRMSLAYAQTFNQKSFNFFGSWSLTEGHVGKMFLGYVVMAVLMIVVLVLCCVVIAVVVVLMFGPPGMPVPAGNSTPEQILAFLVRFAPVLGGVAAFYTFIILPLLVSMVDGAPAAAFKQLARSSRPQAENMF